MSTYTVNEVPETWTVAEEGVYATLSEDLTMLVVWKPADQRNAAGFEVGLYESDSLVSAGHWPWDEPDIAEFIQVIAPADALGIVASIEDDEEVEESRPRRPHWMQVAIGLGKGSWWIIVNAAKFTVIVIKALPEIMAVLEELYQEIDDLMTGGKSRRRRRKASQKEKTALYRQQNKKCEGCQRTYAKKDMTVDHIKPLSRGGSDLYNNKQLLCGHCNSTKGDGTQADLKRALRRKRII